MLLLGGDGRAAAQAFRQAIELHKCSGGPADVAALTFEFGALLLQQKNRSELEELATGICRYFKDRDCDNEIREAVEDFAALVELKALSTKSLVALREKLPEQGTQAEAGKGRGVAQPPGSICQPISGSSPVARLLFGGTSPAGEVSSASNRGSRK